MSDSQGGAPARGYRKVREGYVVSDKMDKTVVVVVEDRVKHPKYGKVIRRTKKYKAHDGETAGGVGARVRLRETGPLWAIKRGRVTKILEKAKKDTAVHARHGKPNAPARPRRPAQEAGVDVIQQESRLKV